MFEVRGAGYRRAMEEAAVPVDSTFIFEYPFDGEWNDYRSGYALGERIAVMPDKPDAMFVFNDLGALGLEDALLDRGVRVPQDIAIVGLDDIELAARARVPLTTVRQPTDRIGASAVDFLLARLRGETPPVRQLFEPTLAIRQSSGASASTDLETGSETSTASRLTLPPVIQPRRHTPHASLLPGDH